MKTYFRAILLCAVAVVGASGCSILNSPDRGLIPDDAGVDGPPDALPDAPPDGAMKPEDCDAPGDEDGNGFENCADFACIYDPICCTGGTDVVDQDWIDPIVTEDVWQTTLADTWPTQSEERGEHRLTEFGLTESPGAVVTQACVPLTYGLSIHTALTAVGGASASDCTDGIAFANVVLTSSQTTDPGERLPQDLAVEMSGCGELRVTRGGTAVGTSWTVSPNTRVPIEITLTPGKIVGSQTFLAVTVIAKVKGDHRLLDAEPLIAETDLLDTGACETAAGLYLAVEGQGDSVQVSPLTATQLDCANPSQFQAPTGVPAQFEAADITDSTWAAGGVGGPACGYVDDKLYLFYDGTNDPRQFEAQGLATVGFALGLAQTTEGTGLWTASGDSPRAGPNPPSCIESGDECTEVSLRDPNLVEGPPGFISFARELINAGDPVRNRYGIDIEDTSSFISDSFGAHTPPTVSPLEPCRSLRDPSLVPAPIDGNRQYWLFFTCIRSIGKPDIRAVRAEKPQGEDIEVPDATPILVLSPEDVPDYGKSGVFAPEVVVEVGDGADEVLYRMWFLARDKRRTKTSVAFAQWLPVAGEDPAFELYPANPVLSEGDAALSACPGKCDITALAVTRKEESNKLLFALARTVNTEVDVTYHLELLSQSWASPWPD